MLKKIKAIWNNTFMKRMTTFRGVFCCWLVGFGFDFFLWFAFGWVFYVCAFCLFVFSLHVKISRKTGPDLYREPANPCRLNLQFLPEHNFLDITWWGAVQGWEEGGFNLSLVYHKPVTCRVKQEVGEPNLQSIWLSFSSSFCKQCEIIFLWVVFFSLKIIISFEGSKGL